MSDRLNRYAAFFEQLTPEALSRLDTVLTEDARFKDPFNDVVGVDAVRRIFEHMYRETIDPGFRVLASAESVDAGFLQWEMTFALRRRPDQRLHIEGMSRVGFAADGRVREHVDYWDPLEGLLSRLPLVGGLFRLPSRLLRTPQPPD